MSDGFLRLVSFAKIGHIGLYRNPNTMDPVEYYCKLPAEVTESIIILLDPMLATGGSSSATIRFLKDRGYSNIRLICLIAAPEGIDVVRRNHPDVDIYVAAVDEALNDHAYIVQGLGDAEYRIFGTK